jgi:hypothetical protein
MPDQHPHCPKCDKLMDRGHIPDVGYGQVQQSRWAPGEPEIRRFLGGIRYRAKELIPMSAYRCPACGFIELYAGPA